MSEVIKMSEQELDEMLKGPSWAEEMIFNVKVSLAAGFIVTLPLQALVWISAGF